MQFLTFYILSPHRSVVEKGFSDPIVLPDSDQYDSVLCTTVADVDFDGKNEILIGTYGQVSVCNITYWHVI